MVERGSHLDQPLQKGLLGQRLLQPQLLPNLVRLEKLARVEKRNTPPELPAFFHRRPFISDRILAQPDNRIKTSRAIIAARITTNDDGIQN